MIKNYRILIIGLICVVLVGVVTAQTRDDTKDAIAETISQQCYDNAINEYRLATDIREQTSQDFHIKAGDTYIKLGEMGANC